MVKGFRFGIGNVLVQGIKNDGVVSNQHVFFVKDNVLHTGFHNEINHGIFQNDIPFDQNLVSADVLNFSCRLIHKIFDPALENAGGESTTDNFFEGGLANLHFVGKVKNIQNVFVRCITDGPKQGCYRKLLFAVDVSIHDVVDVRCKFDPRPLKRNDSSRIEFRPVAVKGLSKEDTGRTVQLRNNHPLCSIDYKGALGGHVRNQTQINLLFDGLKVLVLFVVARKTKLGFERNIVGQTPLNALLDAVTRWIHEVVEEFQDKVVAGIRYRKVLSKHPVQPVVLTMFRKGLQLKKVFE